LKISESTHGEIDAFVTPAADLVGKTIDGVSYDIPALLNYTAVTDYYLKTDPKVLDDLLLTPRKIFTGIKVVKESKSGNYEEGSLIQMERWHDNFDKKFNLPHRRDTYGVSFPNNLEDFTMLAFKTKRE